MPLSVLARRVVNGLWMASCARHHGRFSAALDQVSEVQSRYLLQLIARNAETQLGAKYGFGGISSVAEYQEQVPVTEYESLSQPIEAIASGEQGVLTADRVTRFQPTSGSSSAIKLIPWTASLEEEFRRGISPWVFALYRRRPALLQGTAYWSVSPPAATPRTHGQLRVGFDHDAEYLGFVGQRLYGLVSSVPPAVVRCGNPSEFKTRTMVALLADKHLSLISVWSPTFLTVLLDHFAAHSEEILTALAQARIAGVKERSEFLRSILRVNSEPVLFEQAWPNLKVISCWTHGPSEIFADNLRRLFPQVEIQGKGLVATEAFVSLPFHEDKDPVLAINSHFFEFQDPVSGKIRLAHEVVSGNTYRVIVTTGGGLYRYSMGDLIQVTGFVQEAPCLRFVGREGNVSDLFGEKLQGVFVANVVRRAMAQQEVMPRFFLLAPARDGISNTGYVLFLDAEESPDAGRLAHDLEDGLAESYHYAHCRRLGQLSRARVFRIGRDTNRAEAIFEREMLSRGIKAGDIKALPLDCRYGWEHRFSGRFVG
jgi:hypothetical protein